MKTEKTQNTQDVVITTGKSAPFLHADIRIVIDGKLVETQLYKEQYGNGWAIADGAKPDSCFPTVNEAVQYAVAFARTKVLFAKAKKPVAKKKGAKK